MPAPIFVRSSLRDRLELFMRTSFLTAVMATTASVALSGAASALDHHGHASWGYDGEGGPEYWGMLSADNASCGSGHEQSPIDLHAVSDVARFRTCAPLGCG